jgi:calcium-dependent protein kinase
MLSDDQRCDLWSIGVICYMMLTGSPPFHGKSSTEIHQMILEAEPSYTGNRLRHVSSAAVDFCRKLLVRTSQPEI